MKLAHKARHPGSNPGPDKISCLQILIEGPIKEYKLIHI